MGDKPKYIKVGKSSFLIEAVKGKGITKLKKEFPHLPEGLLRTLIAELKSKKK